MSDYITLHVENFARIRKADIELAPLTLFVGDNNSGKSYLASLVWGLVDYSLYLDFQSHPNLTDIKIDWLQNQNHWICECIKQGTGNYIKKIQKEDHQQIVQYINKFLDRSKKRLIDTVFNSSTDIGHIDLDIPYDEKLSLVMNIKVNQIKKEDTNASDELTIELFIERNGKNVLFTGGIVAKTCQGNYDGELRILIFMYLLIFLKGWTTSFFPASRTGFLLTYRSVIGESLDKRFISRQKSKEDYLLTTPQVSFLQLLAGFDKNKRKRIGKNPGNADSIVEFIEKYLIHGQITLTDTPIQDIMYRPEGLNEYLPMYLSSSIVTEIAPFLACLKYDNIGNRCIIEEPEMSLHPELQWKMAQVLIRLANSISSVLVSTHSDLIIQHINNMIKLANRDDGQELAKEYGFINEDIISPDKIRMYQFNDSQDHLTDVIPLTCNYNGFSVPTFGEAIREIRDQVWAFQIDVDEENAKRKII
ncbi:MAG: ATP-binding protein [Planctomycetaceae bacterium]|jgi:hypothetical protein|nr:ATP-binding protein [Planctomycetaceae bacterium]